MPLTIAEDAPLGPTTLTVNLSFRSVTCSVSPHTTAGRGKPLGRVWDTHRDRNRLGGIHRARSTIRS